MKNELLEQLLNKPICLSGTLRSTTTTRERLRHQVWLKSGKNIMKLILITKNKEISRLNRDVYIYIE